LLTGRIAQQKEFSRLTNDALFATDLLDEYASTKDIHRHRFDEGASPPEYFCFWQSYMVHRLRNPSRKLSKRLVFIQAAAQGYCRKAGTSNEQAFQDCLWVLSDLRIQVASRDMLQDPAMPPTYAGQPGPIDEQRAELVAAVCMNNVQMAKAILDEWPVGKRSWMPGPFSQSSQFQSALYIAARLARNDILRVFYAHPGYQKLPTSFWQGCGMGGNVETLQIMFEKRPPEDIRSGRLAHLKEWPVGVLCHTSHPEVYDWLRFMYRRRKGEDGPDDPFATSAEDGGLGERVLALSASAGRLDMMEHIIQLGVPANPRGPKNAERPLADAARCFQTAAVRLLLQNGTDVNQGDAIARAAAAGSLEIVRTLLHNGANLHVGSPPPLVSAVRLEHVAMFNLLREHGGLGEATKVAALEEASKNGLESMARLLENTSPELAI
jgi:hypothetical protein